MSINCLTRYNKTEVKVNLMTNTQNSRQEPLNREELEKVIRQTIDNNRINEDSLKLRLKEEYSETNIIPIIHQIERYTRVEISYLDGKKYFSRLPEPNVVAED